MVHWILFVRREKKTETIELCWPLLILIMASFFSLFIHVHHVRPFQLQPASCLVYISSIQTPLHCFWLIMISALDWNCGSQTLHL